MRTTWQRTPISILSRVMPEKTTKSVKSQNKAMLSSHVTSCSYLFADLSSLSKVYYSIFTT